MPESHRLEKPHVVPDDDALLHFLRIQTDSLQREDIASGRKYAVRLGTCDRHSKDDPDKVRKNWKLLFVCQPIWKFVN